MSHLDQLKQALRDADLAIASLAHTRSQAERDRDDALEAASGIAGKPITSEKKLEAWLSHTTKAAASALAAAEAAVARLEDAIATNTEEETNESDD